MRVLITGIAGHIGSALAHWIQQNKPGVDIIGIDNYSCGYPENVPKGIKVYKYTLGEHSKLEGLSNVDYVFHFAAYAAEGLSPFIRGYDCRNNLLSTIEVLNYCINAETVKRIVFTSSMSVYGNGNAPFFEADPRKPIDPYGISKAACEQHLEIAQIQHGLEYCIIRPHNVYGPGQSCWQVFRNVLGNWMARSKQGLPLLVYGDGMQRRAFTYIDDILPCLWAAAVEPAAANQIINLGGTTPYTLNLVANVVSNITGSKIEHVEARHEVKNAWCSYQKSAKLLSYWETTSTGEGINQMWQWFCEAWDKYPERRGTHKVAELEVKRGLYSYWRDYV